MGQMHAGKMNWKKSGGEFFRECNLGRKFATASCPATAGFSHQPRRAGVFENGVAEDWVTTGCSVRLTFRSSITYKAFVFDFSTMICKLTTVRLSFS
jgi:hypothetical protein